MKNPSFLTVLLVPALLLLVPLVAMQFTAEVNWTWLDFLVMYVLLSVVGLVYKFFAGRSGSTIYRLAAAMGLGAGFLLVWVNLAVGFIGDEDNPANALYLVVLLVGLVGAGIVRCQARGMAWALFATALTQFLVPVIAFVCWRENFDPDVVKIFGLNFVWVLMFTGSGLLFRHAARTTVIGEAPVDGV